MENLSNKELIEKYFKGKEWKYKILKDELYQLTNIVDARFGEAQLSKVDYKRICSCKPMLLRKLEALVQNEFLK